MKITKYFKNIILYITIFLIFTGCIVNVDDPDENYLIIEVSSSSFTLEWDPPESNVLPDSYSIYYKSHNLNQWILLDTISSNDFINYEVHYNDLVNDGTNEHDFGISAIYNSDESTIHSSLDDSALPNTGWYIKWIILGPR